ncbi:hypothetical protein COO60DRAFT_1743072 [Scenedesmus sp. NREL 46B-D3]|nr:hypothetical protein COO60DRAFT_1743072 [Scenedesmus sp. NREL 46B-D3]
MLQQAASSSGECGNAAAGALGLQAGGCLSAAQQQQQQQQFHPWGSGIGLAENVQPAQLLRLQQQQQQAYALQAASAGAAAPPAAAAMAVPCMPGFVPETTTGCQQMPGCSGSYSPQQAQQQQQLQQQVPGGTQHGGLAVADTAAAAAAPLDGSPDDAAMLQELLDDLWPAGQPAAAVTAAAAAAAGDATRHAGACPAAVAAAAGTAFVPGADPAGGAGGLDSLGEDPAAVAAVDSIVRQLAAQQQEQPKQVITVQQEQMLQSHQAQQQQQQSVVGPTAVTGRQGCNSSSTSNVTNSSSASPGDLQAASAPAAVCEADLASYSYAAYQTACQVQPWHALLSLPVPDCLLHSIAADLRLPGQQPSSQQQQQRMRAHAAHAAQPLLLQQAPAVQPLGWPGLAGSAAAPLMPAGLAGTAAAAAAAAVPDAVGLLGPQGHADLAALQLGTLPGLQQGAVQLQQMHAPAAVSGLNSPQETAASTAAAPGSAAAAAAAVAAAGGNPLAGQLTVAQRAAAASHLRSMLMLAAAAGESSSAVVSRALQLMQQCGDWMPHAALLQLNSLSVKLMGAAPCDLPEDMREHMIAAVVGATMPEAFLRPGCSLITVDVTTSSSSSSSSRRSEADGGRDAAAVLQRLCSSRSWFARREVRMQLATALAKWMPAQQQQQQQGDVDSTGSSSSSDGSGSCTPVAAAAPHVVLASSPALCQRDWQGAWLAVSCHGLSDAEQLQLTARGGGQYYEIDEGSIAVERCGALPSAAAAAAHDTSSSSSSTWTRWLGSRVSRHAAGPAAAAAGPGQSVLVWFRLAEQPRSGGVRVEVACIGSGACGSAVVLVAQEPQLVAEINAAADAAPAPAGAGAGQQSAAAREQQLQALLWELGLVLELKAALLQAYSRHGTAAAAAAAAAQGTHGSSVSCSCGCCCSDGSCSCCRFAGRQLRAYSSAEVVLLVRAARRLLAAAVKAGCPATAAGVMPVAGLGLQGPEQLLAAAAAAAEGFGSDWRGARPSLLHLAVASQNPQMVAWLLAWGRATGVCWLQHVTAAVGGRVALPGLTPLHLAALLGDAAPVADMLTDVSPAAAAAWFGKALAAAVTPAAAQDSSSSSSSSGGAGSSAAAAGSGRRQQQQQRGPAQHHDSAALPGSGACVPTPAAAGAAAASGILLLPDPALRCCGLTPAALAATVGRVVLNASIAGKVPGAAGGGLAAEAAAEAAAAAAGRPPAEAAPAAAEEPLKPHKASALSGAAGRDASGGAEQQLCAVCQLPLTSFNRDWHQHHSPVYLAPPQQQQAPAGGAAAAGFDGVVAGGSGQAGASSSKDQQPHTAAAAAAAGAVQHDVQPPGAAGVPLQLLAALVAGLLLVGLLASALGQLLEG